MGVKAIKLSRNRDQSRLLIKSLATALVMNEKVVTTKTRAKTLAPYFEKLVTKAKKQNLASLRHLKQHLDTDEAVKKMYDDLAKRFEKRQGGYTRINRMGWRKGDDAELLKVSLTEQPKPATTVKTSKANSTQTAAEKETK